MHAQLQRKNYPALFATLLRRHSLQIVNFHIFDRAGAEIDLEHVLIPKGDEPKGDIGLRPFHPRTGNSDQRGEPATRDTTPSTPRAGAAEALDTTVAAGAGHLRQRGFKGIADHPQGIKAGHVNGSDLRNPKSEGNRLLLHSPDGPGLRDLGSSGIEDGKPGRLPCSLRVTPVVFAQLEMPEAKSEGIWRKVVLDRGEPEDDAVQEILHERSDGGGTAKLRDHSGRDGA